MTGDLTIDTIKMVREIRDRMHNEMEGMTRLQRLEYIRREAAEAEQQMGITSTQHHDSAALPFNGECVAPRSSRREQMQDGGTVKERARRLVDTLSDDATWDDLMDAVYVRQSVEEGLEDAGEGRVTSAEDLRASFGLPR